MRRLLAVLTVLGLVVAACSDSAPIESAADTGAEEAVEAQPPSEPSADPAEEVPDQPSVDARVPEDGGEPSRDSC